MFLFRLTSSHRLIFPLFIFFAKLTTIALFGSACAVTKKNSKNWAWAWAWAAKWERKSNVINETTDEGQLCGNFYLRTKRDELTINRQNIKLLVARSNSKCVKKNYIFCQHSTPTSIRPRFRHFLLSCNFSIFNRPPHILFFIFDISSSCRLSSGLRVAWKWRRFDGKTRRKSSIFSRTFNILHTYTAQHIFSHFLFNFKMICKFFSLLTPARYPLTRKILPHFIRQILAKKNTFNSRTLQKICLNLFNKLLYAYVVVEMG